MGKLSLLERNYGLLQWQIVYVLGPEQWPTVIYQAEATMVHSCKVCLSAKRAYVFALEYTNSY